VSDKPKASLQFVGFKKLRPGRIHILCQRCGRKQSNMKRDEEYDPPTAALMHILCERCGNGCWVEGGSYMDARGRWIDLEPESGQKPAKAKEKSE
jgi:ribosomal protein L37E